jgi:aspartokinase-like uncharacterized kinase
VKVGGSLLESGSLPTLLTTLGDLARTHRLVVVPGGGSFADAVRRACALHDPGASAAHWMAILAMDQHAHFLAGLLPTARLASGPDEIAEAHAEGLLPVLSPFRWLREVDPLPHGWHVTSDSIAAWVAARLSARRLVLLKSLDGVPATSGDILAEAPLRSPALAGIVDEYFERAVEPGLECWVLSGHEPRRLSQLLREGRTRGTRLC